MIPPFDFDEDVAIEAVLYICPRVKTPTFHTVSKMMYFADKLHLERYGRFISGDSYVAMKHGPVPSCTYDLMKARRFNQCHLPNHEKISGAFEIEDRYNIVPVREADLDCLSESDIECLDEVIAKYGQKSFGELTSLSHDEAWNEVGENDFIEIEQIAKTFDDPEDLLDYLSDPYR